jgi:dTDP-4-amino-4,6-dideoxygalactose transaminase
MRLFISHGENFDSPDCGENGRMPELTALVAWHGLVELKERNRQRHRLATRLTNALFDSKIYRIPSLYSCTEEDQEHAWYVYPFQVAPGTRDEFIKKLKAKGVGCGAGYMTPGLNDFKAFCQYPSVETKAVDRLSNQTLCIITDLTPDRPVEFATEVARKMRDCLS